MFLFMEKSIKNRNVVDPNPCSKKEREREKERERI